tara:strand:+ start:124 stop:771 length:648 start_codon:yes stop_codon:yes gene_type:complete
MKKLIIAFLAMSLGSFSIASAERGVNIGVSGQMGVFVADGSETRADSGSLERSNTTTLVGYGSVFIEKTLGSKLTIGFDYVPQSLTTDTAESTRQTDVSTTGINSVKADFEDLSTAYVAFNVTENTYIKAGMVTVDVITKESLATGSDYGNTSLDGEMYGVGYNHDFSNGLFLRAEANVIMMDGTTLTSTTNSDNVIKLDHLNGASGKISIGKSF